MPGGVLPVSAGMTAVEREADSEIIDQHGGADIGVLAEAVGGDGNGGLRISRGDAGIGFGGWVTQRVVVAESIS